MPLDSVEAEAILRRRGLWKEGESKSGPPPLPPPPPPPSGGPMEYVPFIGETRTPATAAPASSGMQFAVTEPPAAPTTPAASVPSAPPTLTAPPSELASTVARAKQVIGSMESSDRYDIVHPPAKNGQVALGRYGILASGLAEDSRKYYGSVVSQNDFLKNPAIQDKIFEGRFGDLVQKYGVEGAARAWFAGEGGMNNASASDGNTTVANYATQFMQRFQGADGAGPVRAAGGGLTPEQTKAILEQRGIAPSQDGVRADVSSGMFGDLSPSSMFETAKTQAQDWLTTYAQYEAGVMKGIIGTTLAPFQTVSEMTGDWYKPMEARVSELEEQLDAKTGGKGTWADLTGRVVGSVATIVVGSRALGPLVAPMAARITPQIAQQMWRTIGPVGRSIATAAPLAATVYYPAGSENEKRFGLENVLPVRAIDAATFGLLGPIGGVVSRGATWIASGLSKVTATARSRESDLASEAADAAFKARGPQVQELFNNVLRQTAGDMTQNSERPLRNVISNYANMERVNAQKYALRNAAGQTFEGFPLGVGAMAPSGLKQALGEGAEATREAGVRQATQASTAREAARRELGLAEEEARYRGWQTQQGEYERRMMEWTEATAANPYAGPQLLASMERAGKIPPRPQPPPPFEPTPASPAQLSAARQALSNALGRAKSDAAQFQQINAMIRSVDNVVATEAAAYGVPVKEFMRKAEQARKFYEENIAPLRYGLFRGRTSMQLGGRPGVAFSGMTPTEFHELAMKPVRDNNLERVKDLVKVLGPEARKDMAAMAASEMILLSEKGARKFVNERRDVLTTLLGKDEYRQLQGLASIAEHIQKFKPYVAPKMGAFGEAPGAQNFVSNILQGGSGTRIGKWMAFYEVGKAVFGVGDRSQHLKEAALYFFGPPLAHLAYNITSTMHKIRALRPLVKRAATMEPGSKELDDYLVRIERRIRGTSNATLRGLSEAVDQQ